MSSPSTPSSTPPTTPSPSLEPSATPEPIPTVEASPTPEAEATPEPEAAAAPRSRYSMGSLPNMLRSLLVIGLFVLALFAIVPRMSEVPRPAVDASAKASQVAAQTSWPIELPEGLGQGWVPTVATYAAGTEKVPTFTTVWTTPSGGDIALKEAVRVTDGWLKRSVNDGVPAGTARVSGRTFERYDAEDRGQVSYVVRGAGANGLTIVASGTAPEDELKAFVAALRPVKPAA